MQSYSHELFCSSFFEMTQRHVYNSQTKTMLVNYFQKVSFKVTHTQFRPKLGDILSHNQLFEEFLQYCSIKVDSRQTIVTVNFSKKKKSFGVNGQFRPNLDQDYATMHLIICSIDCFGMLQDDRAYQIDINYGSKFFQKIFLLEEMSNLGQNLPRFLNITRI